MVGAAFRGRRGLWGTELMRGYGAASVVLIGLYPLVPAAWRELVFVVVCLSAVPCVLYGRRWVATGRRLPWTLLLAALGVVVVGNLVTLVPGPWAVAAGWLLDAAGNILFLAAALALALRRGPGHLGGVIDTTVIALAAGGLIWTIVPHRLGTDDSVAAQVNLFVVVFALTGVLGALIRLSYIVPDPGSALGWVSAALGLGIGANVLLTVAGDDPARSVGARMLFLGAFAAIGLFGLDPAAPRLAHPIAAASVERLSVTRLVSLGVALALIPVAIGIRELLGGTVDGVLLAVQGVLVSALVMVRIGLLSTQRDRAERALQYQAAHDPVTALPNRREFVAQLRRQLELGEPCAVLFCDLNDFKAINDRFGHAAGDMLLVEVAQRIRACAPQPHMVSRFGGDEFVVLLVDASPAQARATRDCIIADVAQPFDQVGGATLGVSVGLAFSDGTTDPEDIIREADRDMYRAKPARST